MDGLHEKGNPSCAWVSKKTLKAMGVFAHLYLAESSLGPNQLRHLRKRLIIETTMADTDSDMDSPGFWLTRAIDL